MNTSGHQFLDDFSYCPTLKECLKTRQAVGRLGKQFDQIPISTIRNLHAIRKLMLRHRPLRTLETGLASGGSALTFAATHRDLGAKPESQHVAIDPHQSTVWDDSGRLHLEKAGLAGYVDVREAPSARVLPTIVNEGQTFDFIYIDGSHLFEDVFLDFYYVRLLLVTGGHLLFDDSSNPNVAKVLRFVRRNFSTDFALVTTDEYRDDSLPQRIAYYAARFVRHTQLTVLRKTGDAIRPWDARLRHF